MVVEVYNVRIIGVREAVGKDGKVKLYGNLYTDDGQLYPFVTEDVTISDDLTPTAYQLKISWGTGKNGQWVRCELIGRI